MASDYKTTFKKVWGVIGTVIFFISYIPYLLLIEVGIHGTMSGLFGGIKLYGFEAMCNYIVWLCVVPVFPVCIIYQLIFGIAYIRKRRVLKIITIVLVAVLVIIIINVGVFAVNKKEEQLAAAKPQIEQYLTDKYGEGFVNENTNIRLFSPDDDGYMVTTDVLPDGIEFAVNLSSGDDDLIASFCGRNEGFTDDFTEYTDEQYEMPDNMSLQVRIDSIAFGTYHDSEDYSVLFPGVDYRISGITVDVDNANDESVEELIYEVWEEQFPKFDDQVDNEFITMCIRENGENVFYVVYYIDSRTASVSLYRPTNRVSKLEDETLELP